MLQSNRRVDKAVASTARRPAAPAEARAPMHELVTAGVPLGGALGEQQLLLLQRAAGNEAVAAMVARAGGKPEKPKGRPQPRTKERQPAPQGRKPELAQAADQKGGDALGEMHEAAERATQDPAPEAKAAKVAKRRPAAPGPGPRKRTPRPAPKRPPRTRPKAIRPPRQKPKAKATPSRGPPSAAGNKSKPDAGGSREGGEQSEHDQAGAAIAGSLAPRLAAAGRDILDGAAKDVEEMKAAAAKERQSVLGTAATKAEGLLAEAKAKATATGAALDAKKAATSAGFDAKAAQISAQVTDKQAAARQHGAASLAATDAKAGEQKAALLAKGNERAGAVVQDGEAEATRILEAGKANAAKVSAGAKARIAQHLGDKKAAGKVREAVNEAAAPVISSLQSNSAKGAASAREGAAKKAAAIRQEAVKTAAGLGDKSGDVRAAVRDATDKTVAGIAAIGTSRITGVRSMKDRAAASFADMKSQVTGKIKAAGERSAVMARRGGETAAKAITSSETAAVPAVHRAASEAVSSLGGLGGPRKGAREKAATFAGAVRGKFGEAKQQFAGAIKGQSAQATAGLVTAVAASTPQLQNMAAVSVSAADSAKGSALQGGTAAVADVTQHTTQTVSEGNTAGQKTVGQFASSLEAAVSKADQEWAKDSDKTKSDIKAEAEKAIAGSNNVAVKADADLQSLASNVAADANRSLFGQIVSGIWEGIKGFAIGLGKLLLVAGLVFLVAAALSLVAFTVVGFLTVLAVVGIIFLVFALVEAIDQRAKEIASVLPGDAPWWVIGMAGVAVLGVAVGDVLGVSPIIEGIWGQNIMTGEKLTPEQRSERITAGILQIVTLFLFHSIAKRVGGGEAGEPGKGKGRAKETPLEVIDPYTALGRKYGLRTDIVEMLRKSGLDTKLFDRILARGVDPETVALMADGHGLRGVRILDRLSADGVSAKDIVKLVEGADSLGKLKELAEATDRGTVGKLLKRGFTPDEINLILDEVSSTGLGTTDGLMDMGVNKPIAIDAARIAKRIGAEAEVNKLVRDGNLRNANGFRRFLQLVETEVKQGKHGLLNELKEAAARSRAPDGSGKDGVALGKEGANEADVIDFGRKEALQMKTVTGDASALAENVNKAARQLRGETGEVPPTGFAKIVKIIIEGGKTADLGRSELLQTMKDSGVTESSLKDVSRVEVRNNKGSFTFEPKDFR